jgi:AcrR family transcriptional regulator
MGRRSTHTHEELRELVLRSAQEIIEADGLAGLSAREIARKIGYSPGTLYNLFNNLNDLILHVEDRLLEALDKRLSEVERSGSPEQAVRRFAQAYLSFTHERPKVWNLLFEHHVPGKAAIPAWYQERIEGLTRHIEEAIAPLAVDSDPAAVRRYAHVLWASIHGITSLSTAPKPIMISTETAQHMIDDLVTIYVAGLRALKGTAQ